MEATTVAKPLTARPKVATMGEAAKKTPVSLDPTNRATDLDGPIHSSSASSFSSSSIPVPRIRMLVSTSRSISGS